MSIKVIASLVVCITLIVGCETKSYKEPITEFGNATIYNHSSKSSLFNWMNVSLYAVGDEKVSYRKEMWSPSGESNASREIRPGISLLTARVKFNEQFISNGPYEAFVRLPVFLEPSKQYQLNAQRFDRTIKVWLTNRNTGELIELPPGFAEYSQTARGVVVIPIPQ